MKNCASSWLFTRVTSKLSCISYKRQLTTCCSYTDRLLYMRLLLYDTCFKNDNSVCWFSKLLQMHITSEYNNRERWRVTRLRKTFTIINQLIYWLQETGVTGGGFGMTYLSHTKKKTRLVACEVGFRVVSLTGVWTRRVSRDAMLIPMYSLASQSTQCTPVPATGPLRSSNCALSCQVIKLLTSSTKQT